MKQILLILFACISSTIATAQEQWTLQRCIEYALDNNLSIKQAQLSVILSYENLNQSRLSILPNVNGNASQNYNFGRSIDPLTNQFVTESIESANYGINSSVVLFSGFQKLNTIRQNRYQMQSDKSNLAKIKNDVSLNVATLYLQVLYTKELIKINQNQLQISKEQLSRAEKNVAAGAITQGDLLAIKAQVAQEELNTGTAQNQYQLAYLNLKQILEFSYDDTLTIVEPQTLKVAPLAKEDTDEVYRMALQTQPDIDRVDFALRSARKGLAAAKGAVSPRLSLGSNLGTGYSSGRQRVVPGSSPTLAGSQLIGVTTSGESVYQPIFIPQIEKTPFRTQIDQNLSQSVSISLQIPLLNGWQIQSGIKRAKINLQNAEIASEIARKNLSKTVIQATMDARAAEQRYLASQRSVESLTAAFTYTEQKFAVGLINSLDYSISKNNLAKAETELLQAKYDFIFKNKVIDFYLGNPLSFD